MYCPNCGSNQSEGKKFCTICGTNLQIVTQALSGQLSPVYSPPPVHHPYEIERQRETARGIRLAIIGGGFLVFKFFNMIVSGGSVVSPLSFIGFILLAVGVSKLLAFRPAEPAHKNPLAASFHPPQIQQNAPASANVQSVHSSAPRTSELPSVPHPAPSVTEDDTRRFPHHSPQ